MENKNEMKSINKTLTKEFKAKGIQSLSFFFLAMLIDKTEYMLSTTTTTFIVCIAPFL